jgi:hypothetical protein
MSIGARVVMNGATSGIKVGWIMDRVMHKVDNLRSIVGS